MKIDPKQRRKYLRNLVVAIKPEIIALSETQIEKSCLVAATAPLSQIRNFHFRMKEIFPTIEFSYFGSRTRATEIQEMLNLSETQILRLNQDGSISNAAILESGLQEKIRSFNSCIVLINNVAGIGYENVISALFEWDFERILLHNIHDQLLSWSFERWEIVSENRKELETLLSEVYQCLEERENEASIN